MVTFACFRIVGVRMVSVEELYDMEAAFVYIEVDVPRFKVWCAGLPDYCFGIKPLDFMPCSSTDTLTVSSMGYKQKIQVLPAET